MLLGISGMQVRAEPERSRFRRADVPCVRADVSRISGETGWHARIPLRESLQAMWNDAMSRGMGGEETLAQLRQVDPQVVTACPSPARRL